MMLRVEKWGVNILDSTAVNEVDVSIVKATIPLTRRTLVQRRRGQFIHKFL